MFVSFSVGNFYSFDKAQTLSIDIENSRKNYNSIEPHTVKECSNCAIIYGANSSGKSNFIKALIYFQNFVANGSADVSNTKHLDKSFRKRNRMDEVDKNSIEPSHFEMIMNLGGIRYTYGFKILTHNGDICEEWLNKIKDNNSTTIFHIKTINRDSSKTRTKPDRKSELWIRSCIDNCIDDSYNEAKKVRNWILSNISIIPSKDKDMSIPVGCEAIVNLNNNISCFDLDITEIIEEPFINKDIPINLINSINKDKKDTWLRKNDRDEIVFVHGNELKKSWLIHKHNTSKGVEYFRLRFKNKDGYIFDYGQESLGTGRVLFILSLLESLKIEDNYGKFLAIDELECSIHTSNTCTIIDLYHKMNLKNTLLMVTSHETMLLNSKYTKPEEIWFVNRNHSTDNGSRIYSLKEYLIRSKDYSKPYLEGDFQAIPYIIDPYMEGL